MLARDRKEQILCQFNFLLKEEITMDYNRKQHFDHVPFHRTPVGAALGVIALIVIALFAWLNWKPHHYHSPSSTEIKSSPLPIVDKQAGGSKP